MTELAAPAPAATALVLPTSRALAWSLGALLMGAVLYYFVGIDQGAYSIFGSDTHVHEFVHDARHVLGYPCH